MGDRETEAGRLFKFLDPFLVFPASSCWPACQSTEKGERPGGPAAREENCTAEGNRIDWICIREFVRRHINDGNVKDENGKCKRKARYLVAVVEFEYAALAWEVMWVW